MGHTGVAGVKGQGRNERPSDRAARRRGRLPIEEATHEFLQVDVPGKMHACGHDGHTVMLLGAAKYLAETSNFDGTV